MARVVLLLFTVPFLINYIVRNVAWTGLLGRTGTINTLLMAAGIIDAAARLAALQRLRRLSRPHLHLHAVHDLSAVPVDRGASTGSISRRAPMLGASAVATFLRITLPLSLPGIFAAVVFGFVGCLGESAVPIIMGGVGYELLGNTITSSMDVLNYPLAAALSSVVIVLMLLLMVGWYLVFDLQDLPRQDPGMEELMDDALIQRSGLVARLGADRGWSWRCLYVPDDPA